MAKIVITLLLLCIGNICNGAVKVILLQNQNSNTQVFLVGQNNDQTDQQTSNNNVNRNDNRVNSNRQQSNNNANAQPTQPNIILPSQNVNRGQPITVNSRGNQGDQPRQQQSPGTSVIHDTTSGSNYHFSWRRDRDRKFSHGDAVNYCRNLGDRWNAISIETTEESDYINGVIDLDNVPYIWTSGTKVGNGWRWNGPGAGAFQGLNWSSTGGLGIGQPDNRFGDENCLGILNRFYINDGITWHDIACFHLKPVACERRL
ncbi:uncharacterized protein DDB_G0283357-like [Penaeus indicus]|uniref:uncharacterized protein DDB_G0283357-like n=1 Tax=Penaeus indicus TaxID=29960 RepID=UPI00300CA28E